MLLGEELSEQVYQTEHINNVLSVIQKQFPKYFRSFSKNAEDLFNSAIQQHEKEKVRYQEYLDLETLEEYDVDPNAFKKDTRTKCPIIHRCLMSQDEVMQEYKKSFNSVVGRDLYVTIYNIAVFGHNYVDSFKPKRHESAKTFEDLRLEDLSDEDYTCLGVVGFGIQSSLLYGLYPHAFAHRSQNSVWALYFLSERKDFGLGEAGSEFLMVRPQYGTCEQNYNYPPELFSYYALQIYLMLKSADPSYSKLFNDEYRYIYLDVFFDHVANKHREDINALKWTSEHVENHWH